MMHRSVQNHSNLGSDVPFLAMQLKYLFFLSTSGEDYQLVWV